MTDAERRAVDADPLWSDEGQVLWFLEQVAGTDELTSVSMIAAELGCQRPVVVSALRNLGGRGEVASRLVGGRKVWGTAVQIHRMDVQQQQLEADRVESVKRIVDRNRDLEDVRGQLAASLGGRGIEVATVSRLYPSAWNDGRIDQLLVTTDDPDAAGWLLGRLSGPGSLPDIWGRSGADMALLEKSLLPGVVFAGYVRRPSRLLGRHH